MTDELLELFLGYNTQEVLKLYDTLLFGTFGIVTPLSGAKRLRRRGQEDLKPLQKTLL